MNFLLEVSGKSKQEECENSQMEFHLDKEVLTPFLLQMLQRSLKTKSDGEPVSDCISHEHMCAQAVTRDIRESVTSVLTRKLI